MLYKVTCTSRPMRILVLWISIFSEFSLSFRELQNSVFLGLEWAILFWPIGLREAQNSKNIQILRSLKSIAPKYAQGGLVQVTLYKILISTQCPRTRSSKYPGPRVKISMRFHILLFDRIRLFYQNMDNLGIHVTLVPTCSSKTKLIGTMSTNSNAPDVLSVAIVVIM